MGSDLVIQSQSCFVVYNNFVTSKSLYSDAKFSCEAIKHISNYRFIILLSIGSINYGLSFEILHFTDVCELPSGRRLITMEIAQRSTVKLQRMTVCIYNIISACQHDSLTTTECYPNNRDQLVIRIELITNMTCSTNLILQN